jgi:predicted RNase H-like HicB family nuclease
MEEGGYLAVVPALPGVVSYGATLAEARAMVADAIRCHCEGLLKAGEPLPPNRPIAEEPVKEEVTVQLEYA